LIGKDVFIWEHEFSFSLTIKHWPINNQGKFPLFAVAGVMLFVSGEKSTDFYKERYILLVFWSITISFGK